MGRDIRTFRRGAVYYVTNRTYRDELRLTPSPAVNLLCRSTLIQAARFTGVRIAVSLFMGNHFELVIEDPYELLDTCMEIFQRELSHKLNRMRGIKHTNFPERYDVHELGNREACDRKIVEVLCNPVRAGLVYNVDDWPGMSTLAAHRAGATVIASAHPTRPQAAELAECDDALAPEWLASLEQVCVPLGRPSYFEGMSDREWHAHVVALVDAEEERLQDEFVRTNGRTVGRSRILGESWWDRPGEVAWRDYRRCITTEDGMADAYDRYYKETERRYKKAAQQWRHHGRWGDYPPGTFPPGWLKCLPCSAAFGPPLPWVPRTGVLHLHSRTGPALR